MTTDNRTAVIGAFAIFTVLIVSLTVLLAFDKDPQAVVTFAVGTLVPSILALAARKEATLAKVAAEEAVHNTNGRMTELIRVISDQGKELPVGYGEAREDGDNV